MCILYATYFFKVQFKSDNKQNTSPLASECECEIFFVHTFDSIVCTGRMLEARPLELMKKVSLTQILECSFY